MCYGYTSMIHIKITTVFFPFLMLICVICGTDGKEKTRIRLRLENGEIEGRRLKTVDTGKRYYSFEGIPYAKPPLGDLRFASPQPAEKWNSVLDAKKPRSTCIEMYFPGRGSEDCLYLNVFTPNPNSSLPVIVWIHGGSFVFLYPAYTLNGTDFFMDENVVFVTIHYRLGPFGFLSTEDDVLPGNYGLKDQVLAIEWVHKNIAAFGGDPQKITVMGESSGASASGYMGMTPRLRGKIYGVIQQSGSPICPFGLGRYNRVGTYVLSTRMGLQTQNSSAILEMLRKADAEALNNNSLAIYEDIIYGLGAFQSLLFTPGIETKASKDPLITDFPYEQLKRGDFTRVHRLIGFNSLEGNYMVDEFQSRPAYYNNYDQMVKRFIPFSMNTRNNLVGELIKKHYTNGAPFLQNISNAVHFGGDDQFVRPIAKDASLVSKYVNTYFYQFSYEGNLGWPERPLKGVSHGEELGYLFLDRSRGTPSKHDAMVRKKLVRLWSNFAKYGNPTPGKDDLLDNQIWLPIAHDSGSTNYMDIGSKLVPSVNPHNDDVLFWNNLYDTYGNPPFDTY